MKSMSRDYNKELESLLPDSDYRLKMSERLKEEEFFNNYSEKMFSEEKEDEEKENA